LAKKMEAAPKEDIRCVLLAERHHGLTEGVRGLLATAFDVVVMVADEVSLVESADRLLNVMAVVDFSLTQGDGLCLVRRLRSRFPKLPLIVISVHDEPNVSRSAIEAGADGFVLKSRIATDLLSAVDAVLSGLRYVSPMPRTAGAKGEG
jgi:DNA-binding NarL/FixJ family response regulator